VRRSCYAINKQGLKKYEGCSFLKDLMQKTKQWRYSQSVHLKWLTMRCRGPRNATCSSVLRFRCAGAFTSSQPTSWTSRACTHNTCGFIALTNQCLSPYRDLVHGRARARVYGWYLHVSLTRHTRRARRIRASTTTARHFRVHITKEPRHQGTKEPRNQGTKEPRNQGTKERQNERRNYKTKE